MLSSACLLLGLPGAADPGDAGQPPGHQARQRRSLEQRTLEWRHVISTS